MLDPAEAPAAALAPKGESVVVGLGACVRVCIRVRGFCVILWARVYGEYLARPTQHRLQTAQAQFVWPWIIPRDAKAHSITGVTTCRSGAEGCSRWREARKTHHRHLLYTHERGTRAAEQRSASIVFSTLMSETLPGVLHDGKYSTVGAMQFVSVVV